MTPIFRSPILFTFLRTLAVLLLALLMGVTYQGVATAMERRQFPRPGRMVDVGGHQLHLYCVGEGRPTVVLEAPAAGMSASWGWVQTQAGRLTRTCSYDRAGQGWSESRDGSFRTETVPEELHGLLERGGERFPVVVVGHGLGASFARLFASRFPSETAALVLVDAPERNPSLSAPSAIFGLSPLSPWFARSGLLRLTGTLSKRADGLPEPAAGRLSAFLNRPDHLSRASEELTRWNEITRLAADAPISSAIKVTQVDAAGRDRVAFLSNESDAARVTAAIRAAILARRR